MIITTATTTTTTTTIIIIIIIIIIINNVYRGYHQANTKLIRVILYLHYYNLLCGIKN